jgi:alpha-L-fucosidase
MKLSKLAGLVLLSAATITAAQSNTQNSTPSTTAASSAAAASTAPSPTTNMVQRPPETPEQHDRRMAWWRRAKFGMFIHFGLYAIPADGEWHMRKNQMPLAEYKKYAAQFNPSKFNADDWAGLAHDAGMKYLVLTTKHHDGFALFHSKASDYNIYDATPFHRDLLKELADACPRHDIKLGTYYSVIADWGHPGGGAGCPKWDKAQEGNLDDYINNVSVPQVKELLTNYGPIAVMWFDSDGSDVGTVERASRYAPILALQPDIIVDPRLQHFPADFQTPEGHIPMIAPPGDWELCDHTNASWGYTPAPARPLDLLLHTLCEAWGKGGNVLLNVGPNAEGVIPADSAQRLREIGAWLKANGESIYGSKRGPFEYVPWGYETLKGDTMYLLVFDWPKDGKLKLPETIPLASAALLADPSKPLTSSVEDGKTVLDLPAAAPDPIVSVVAVKLSGEVTPTHSLLLNKPVTASENQRSASTVVNGGTGGDWRIPSDHGTLEVDMGSPQTFATMRATMPYTKLAAVRLEYKDGDQWKTAFEDTSPHGTQSIKDFPPVTARVVRLTVLAHTPGIRVGAFELFPPL